MQTENRKKISKENLKNLINTKKTKKYTVILWNNNNNSRLGKKQSELKYFSKNKDSIKFPLNQSYDSNKSVILNSFINKFNKNKIISIFYQKFIFKGKKIFEKLNSSTNKNTQNLTAINSVNFLRLTELIAKIK